MGKSGIVDFDLIILGGGPLACAIARDATGRGLRVLVSSPKNLGGTMEQQILASGLASLSPQPAPSVTEMNVMQRVFPQFSPQPETSVTKPSLVQRLLSAKPAQTTYAFSATAASRFALLNARDAADRGAVMLPLTTAQTRAVAQDYWQIDITSKAGGAQKSVTARILVDTLSDPAEIHQDQTARLAVYPKTGRAQATGHTTGTSSRFLVDAGTGTVAVGLLSCTPPSEDDLAAAAQTFAINATPTWVSAVLPVPLPAKPLAITNTPPRLVLRDGDAGGWRKRAEEVVAEMAPFARMIGKPWTAFATLPGGDFQLALRSSLIADLHAAFPDIELFHLERLFSHYGTDCTEILDSPGGLGHHFGAGLFEAEVRWLLLHEWAKTARDILWRSTGLGLQMTADQITGLDQWISQNGAGVQQV